MTNSGNLIIRAAKATDTAVIIVGHVTKEGTLAGPKVLEHLVDVVLNFEGDRYGGFKTIRAVKNRFGSTNEVAIFEMFGSGLKEVQNPSAALLAERTNTDGSVILATLEGIVAEAGVATDAIGAEASAQAALKWAAKLSDPDNFDLRHEYSDKMKSVTDGNGARRAARIILDHLSGYEM